MRARKVSPHLAVHFAERARKVYLWGSSVLLDLPSGIGLSPDVRVGFVKFLTELRRCEVSSLFIWLGSRVYFSLRQS